ncbi:MAG: serine/threonine protein kinase [Blastocatellia bacterium]|nr:serine/threonine protein kinase [Blastocatellia bacterium]MBN8722997.1 serine/threonine protein kinase [Acidobacteriota bacterium]
MLSEKMLDAQNRYNKLTEVFLAALDCSSAERPDFLSQVCANDTELLKEVELLIKNNSPAKAFLEKPIAKLDLATLTESPEKKEAKEAKKLKDFIGQKVDKYIIKSKIGEGGMGVVFEAIRSDAPDSKSVAIKILSTNILTIQERFNMEYQIMANLEHPFIARLLDNGKTNDNLPYLVMELVDGQAIDQYCQNQKLNVIERLKLFLKVCEAVEYAHLHLVVHRDLKPSNILVTSNATPKLLDFGIAKIIKHNDINVDVTKTGSRLMTPAYASPEQILGKPTTVSVDIYALGILLYKLLTNNLPYQIKDNSFKAIEKVICEQIPLKPSIAVTENKKLSKKEEQQLVKTLMGDLDNILLMALRKESERRYKSVSEFAQDIQRYLNGFPVIARKDTFKYRASKFIGRNFRYLVTSILIIFLIFAGITTTLWQAKKAQQEKIKAEAQGQLLKAQSELASQRAKDIRSLSNALMFKYNDELEKLPGATALRQQMISEALNYLDGLNSLQNTDLELQRELALAYQRVGDIQGRPFRINLGNTSAALISYQKSLKIFEDLAQIAPNNPQLEIDLSNSLERVGEALDRTGDINMAMKYFQKALAIREKIVRKNIGNLEYLYSLASCYTKIGDNLATRGDFVNAMVLYCKTLSIRTNLVKQEPDNQKYHRGLATIHARFILIYQNIYDLINKRIGQINVSKKLLEKCLYYNQLITETAKKSLENEPENPFLQSELAGCYLQNSSILLQIGDLDDISLLEEAISIFEKLAKSDSENKQYLFLQANAYRIMADIKLEKQLFDHSITFCQQAKNIYQELFTNDPNNSNYQSYLAYTHKLLALNYVATDKNNDAKEHLITSFDLYQKLVDKSPDNIYFQTNFLDTFNQLTKFLVSNKDIAEATLITQHILQKYQLTITNKQISNLELTNLTWLLIKCEPAALRNKALASQYFQELAKNNLDLISLLNSVVINDNPKEKELVENLVLNLLDCTN